MRSQHGQWTPAALKKRGVRVMARAVSYKEEMKIYSRSKRSKWSLLTQFWAAVCIAIVTSLVVILVMKKSLWIELENASLQELIVTPLNQIPLPGIELPT